MVRIVKNLVEAREELNARDVLLTPCGHGYRVLRWEAENLLGQRFPFSVFTFAEILARYLQEGRIKLKRDVVEGPITYHDPCNMARHGGVIEEPRNVLRALSSNFVEMQPHGAWNFCCGGGGGLSATGDYGNIRLQVGKVKADQIKATGAKTVITNCYNCRTQISELNRKYKLGVEVKSIVEAVADSLDLAG
jgi:Fe-S oxidoreductase